MPGAVSKAVTECCGTHSSGLFSSVCIKVFHGNFVYMCILPENTVTSAAVRCTVSEFYVCTPPSPQEIEIGKMA